MSISPPRGDDASDEVSARSECPRVPGTREAAMIIGAASQSTSQLLQVTAHTLSLRLGTFIPHLRTRKVEITEYSSADDSDRNNTPNKSPETRDGSDVS